VLDDPDPDFPLDLEFELSQPTVKTNPTVKTRNLHPNESEFVKVAIANRLLTK
jgi:hypothetical protein